MSFHLLSSQPKGTPWSWSLIALSKSVFSFFGISWLDEYAQILFWLSTWGQPINWWRGVLSASIHWHQPVFFWTIPWVVRYGLKLIIPITDQYDYCKLLNPLVLKTPYMHRGPKQEWSQSAFQEQHCSNNLLNQEPVRTKELLMTYSLISKRTW